MTADHRSSIRDMAECPQWGATQQKAAIPHSTTSGQQAQAGQSVGKWPAGDRPLFATKPRKRPFAELAANVRFRPIADIPMLVQIA